MNSTGTRRRLGFTDKKNNYNLMIQRSEEILPPELNLCLVDPETQSIITPSRTVDDLSSVGNLVKCQPALKEPAGIKMLNNIDGFGVGQVASRQALVSPQLGGIQLALTDQRGMLEVSVIQVRNLKPKIGDMRLPCKY